LTKYFVCRLKFEIQPTTRLAVEGRLNPLSFPQSIKFFSCPNLFGTTSKRKDLQNELFWPPLIFLKLMIRSGTLSQTTDSRSSALLYPMDPILSVRQKGKRFLPWCSKPLVSNQTQSPSELRP